MVRAVLWMFDRVAFVLRLAGADYPQFRAILQAKLMLDNRRQMVAFRTRGPSPRNTFAISLGFYAFMGLFVAMVLVGPATPLTALTIVHSLSIVLVGMSLIADFTGVLIDTTDTSILGPRPVSGRTMLMARLAHIGTYLGLLAVAFSAVTLIVGAVVCGALFPPVCLGTLICSLLLVVFLVNVFYLVALHFTDGERFKDLIAYFQIVMMVALIGGYQFLPRLIDVQDLGELELAGRWWTYLYPPCWFAAPIELIYGQAGGAGGTVANPSLWILTLEAVLIPVAGLVVVVRYLAPGFGRSLMSMGTDVAGPAGGASGRKTGLGELLGGWLVRSREQRVGFDLVWNMASRDRQFKLRVYPQFAFLFLWPIIMLVTSEKGPAAVIANLGASKSYLFLLYLAAFSLPAAFMMIQYSSQFEAAWIYYALPLERPGALMVGALKAMACRFALPLFGLFAILLVPVVGPAVLVDVALALCFNGVVVVAVAWITIRNLPFSENVTALQSGGRFGRALPLLLLPGLAGGAHYGLTFIPYAVPLSIVPAAVLYWLLIRAYGRLDWSRFGMQPVSG
ncbi:MAG TPA: hypothetical protein VM243_02920 [Phycisphaerae bacterium]|nr:hypothetical protein [Phycisphaerae bacterium]